MNVLVIEDNYIDAHIAETMMRSVFNNISVYHCQNGQVGLDYLQEHQQSLPDMILLDINMPVMDGKEFLKKKGENPGFKEVPVVMLTSSGLTGERIECMELGASDFLEKPITVEMIKNHMRPYDE